MTILKKLLESNSRFQDIALNALARMGHDFNGTPDRMYIDRIRRAPSECTIPEIPVEDKITTKGEQAVLFLPDSIRRRPWILGPILERFPNYLLFGMRRDIMSVNPYDTYERLEEICDLSLRYVRKKGIDPNNLTVLGICSDNIPATRLAHKLSAKNLYSVSSAGTISEGVFSSDATKNEVAELIQGGFNKEAYHELMDRFDPIKYLDGTIRNVVGVFGGRDRMVKKSAWEPLAERIAELGGSVKVYKNLGHCTSMYRFARELGRREI